MQEKLAAFRGEPLPVGTLDFGHTRTGFPQDQVRTRHGAQLKMNTERFAKANESCAGSAPDAIWLSCDTD